MNQFRNLKIWKRAVDLATQIYKVTQQYPSEERYGLTSQMRRGAVSISSNISEGAGRNSNKEFRQFLNIAYGSSCELETQLIISSNLNLLDFDSFNGLTDEIHELQKMIYAFSNNLN